MPDGLLALSMNVEVEHKPSYALAIVTLDLGDALVAESGAMVAMDADILASPGFHGSNGGLGSMLSAAFFALVRRYLTGESVFVNEFKAKKAGQRVFIAPAFVGDVVHMSLEKGESLTVQAGSWMAASKSVGLSLQWGGFSALFARENPFFVRCSGPGEVIINAYGAIESVDIDGEWVVDSGHVVGWQGKLTHTLRKAGGWVSSVTSGEGLVLAFKGKGRIYMQTRNTSALVGWLTPLFPG